MKKFVYLYQGYQEPSEAVMEAWMSWFGEIGDSIVDGGNPFGQTREVTQTGSRDLESGPDSVTGYTIVNADSIDDAEKLLANCPINTSVRIYEAMAM